MVRSSAILLLLFLAGCAGSLERSSTAHPLAPNFAAIPLPSELKGVSLIPGERSLGGAQYELALPNSRVNVVGTSLQYAADPALSSLADLSFAMYELDVNAYSGAGLLGLLWQGGAPPADGIYVGLANFSQNRWEWMAPPPSGETDLGLYGDYLSSVDNRMVITVLSTRFLTSTLDEVYFGTPGLDPPTGVDATDSLYTNKVRISWDAPAAGPTPEGYDVYRADSEAGPYALLGNTALLTYDDSTVTIDTVYWYKLKSIKTGEPDSAFSSGNDGLASAGGVGWSISTVATFTTDPNYLTMALVNDHPAVAYARADSNYTMFYVRAQDTAGSAWNAKVNLGLGWQEPCLGYFGGRPGISFAGPLGGQNLLYRRGTNADGDTFEPSFTVHDPPGGYVVNDPDMVEVGGNPAIAFRRLDFVGSTGYELCYIRATDAVGDVWPASHVVADAGEHAYNPQLGVLSSGFPAIIYAEQDKDGSDPVKIKFVRATNATGSSWQPPVLLYTLGDENTIAPVQFVIAGGRPAAVFHDGSVNTNSLYYKRADDVDGDTWP
ncbi:MAG: hypothetical protein M3R04_04940, partial [bacterium]|nr:hypothetical protein [bacterium]